jgi:DinB superfamily
MTKEQIISEAKNTFGQFTTVCEAVNDILFFENKGDKWSVAENVKHLVISTTTTNLAYTLPKFLVRWIGGTANRPSKTYDELVAKYKQKLAEGGRASGRFVPKAPAANETKALLLKKWDKATLRFINSLQQNRTEADLDKYLIRHPLLGRITLRELCYFTIYHTKHHQYIIEQRTLSTSA